MGARNDPQQASGGVRQGSPAPWSGSCKPVWPLATVSASTVVDVSFVPDDGILDPVADATEPDPALSGVRAIVIDTNGLGSRHLHLGRLRTLVRQARAHGQLEVWIPQTVIWEWAEHAYAERQAAVQALKRIRATGLELPDLPEVSREGILDEIESMLDSLGPPLMVLPVGDVAEAALRDQILQLGPADAKAAKDGSVIKTGAADSALLRAVLEYSGDDPTTFAVVSADSDILKAFASWGADPPAIYNSIKTALQAILLTVPPDAAVPWASLGLLSAEIDELSLGRLRGDLFSEMSDIGYAGEVANQEAYADEGRQLVGLSELALDRDAGYLAVTVHLLTTVHALGVVQDAWGDSVVPREIEMEGAAIRIGATFELDTGGRPVAVEMDEGEGLVIRADREPQGDPEDVLAEVLDVMTLIPGMSDFEWPDGLHNGCDTEIELEIGKLRLEISGDVFSDWTLTGRLGDREASISCTFMNDGFADNEGFVIPGHCLLTSSESGHLYWNPIFTINLLALQGPQAGGGPGDASVVFGPARRVT